MTATVRATAIAIGSLNDAAIVISGKKSKAMRVGDCGVCEERGGVHS